MVADDVTASDCVHTNLIYRPLTRNPMSAVDNVFIWLFAGGFTNFFRQASRQCRWAHLS